MNNEATKKRLPTRPAGNGGPLSVNEVVRFSNRPLDFFYAAPNQMVSTVMKMTISLTASAT